MLLETHIKLCVTEPDFLDCIIHLFLNLQHNSSPIYDWILPTLMTTTKQYRNKREKGKVKCINLWLPFYITWKLGILTKIGPKTAFFQFIEKFGHWFLLHLFYNENLCYLVCFYTNPIFGKVFVPEKWAKIFLANQIEEFINQPYLQNKSLKWPVFFSFSHKAKFDQNIFGWE